MRCTTDPLSRLLHISYKVPEGAPETVRVRCEWRAAGGEAWSPAVVRPFLSQTALNFSTAEQQEGWAAGTIVEGRAAGLERTVVFNPYPDAQVEGRVEIDFRVTVLDEAGKKELGKEILRIAADNRDVVYLDDWHKVLQQEHLTAETIAGKWTVPEAGHPLAGNALADLPQLTYPLDLKGEYAVFVRAPARVRLRFSGEERYERISTPIPGYEELWQWRLLDRQHLVVRQNYSYTGPAATTLDYVKLVPLTAEQVAALEAQFAEPDRFVASYWEPYSYAFSDDVQDVFWHREFLGAYREARVGLVDMQIGRFGMKKIYETRVSDQLLFQTQGDPIGAVQHPQTTNVGRMQQYTNTLECSLRFAREFDLNLHANFGASNCYPGSPLQGEISKQHPEWMRGSALRYEVPEVRKHILASFRETLEIGVKGLSVDFCRYPETIDRPETATFFLRELRALAKSFGSEDEAIRILLRFPAHGVRRSLNFDYKTWIREELVDWLCPSSIQGRFHYFDIKPYQEAVAGTSCQLLPQVDALSWGLPVPGMMLERVSQLYDLGAMGVYVYQGDALVFGNPHRRRCLRLFGNAAALKRHLASEAELVPKRSKGIYLSRPNHINGYHGWERIHIWLEGLKPGAMEIYLGDRLLERRDGPPYMVGPEDGSGDKTLPKGKHQLRIRVRDGEGWFEQTFAIVSAG